MNAIRHASGKLDIGLAVQEGTAVLSLANSAPHLRGSDPELLFNGFYMADESRSGLSSGLGLSISRGLMVKMGGSPAEANDWHDQHVAKSDRLYSLS
ncbi:ATP-binding protein [Cohnella suwonensis]|uniref:ATP-binding protein n=1 Tax=Cohnella suwonensis TaxID=696072 RepID=A0ABW0LU90_9BACL